MDPSRVIGCPALPSVPVHALAPAILVLEQHVRRHRHIATSLEHDSGTPGGDRFPSRWSGPADRAGGGATDRLAGQRRHFVVNDAWRSRRPVRSTIAGRVRDARSRRHRSRRSTDGDTASVPDRSAWRAPWSGGRSGARAYGAGARASRRRRRDTRRDCRSMPAAARDRTGVPVSWPGAAGRARRP